MIGSTFTRNVIVKESEVNPITPGVNIVNDVLQHDGESDIGLSEKEGVSRYILPKIPEYSVRGGLRSAGTEELRPGEPNRRDPIVLRSIGGARELKDGV